MTTLLLIFAAGLALGYGYKLMSLLDRFLSGSVWQKHWRMIPF